MTIIPVNHQIEEVQDYITRLNNPPAVNCVPFFFFLFVMIGTHKALIFMDMFKP